MMKKSTATATKHEKENSNNSARNNKYGNRINGGMTQQVNT